MHPVDFHGYSLNRSCFAGSPFTFEALTPERLSLLCSPKREQKFTQDFGMLDVTAKLGADVGPGTSSDPFQPHLLSNRPMVRWEETVPLQEGLVRHTSKVLLPPAPTVQSRSTNRRTRPSSEERMWKLSC